MSTEVHRDQPCGNGVDIHFILYLINKYRKK